MKYLLILIFGILIACPSNGQFIFEKQGRFYWDGTDYRGLKLPTGVYILKLFVNGQETATAIVVKG